MIRWHITPSETGLSALELLRQRLPGAPRAYLRQLLRRGRIRRGEHELAAGIPLLAGDTLALPSSRRLLALLPAMDLPAAELILETPHFLAAAKPAGLAVHRAAGHQRDHLQGRVQALLARRGEPTWAAPVHRLDIPTSGPVLFARTSEAAARLGSLFEAGAVVKTYLALAAGELPATGLLRDPVRSKGRLRAAATSYRRVARGEGLTLLEVHPETGRTHQIRQHLAGAGHPLIGDRRYAGPPLEHPERIFLHCLRLEFPDPWGRETLRIEAPLPRDLQVLLDSADLVPEDTSLAPALRP